jgi:hypothetical protein
MLVALLCLLVQPTPASPATADAAKQARGGAKVHFTTLVSGPTPFGDDCGDPGNGDGIPGAEVEVHLAVDPSDPDHLLATWQQDRYTSGGAARSNLVASSLNGGRSWSRRTIPDLSWCTGEDAARPRASDPWVAIGVDGIAYLASTTVLATDLDVDLDLPIAASADGGRSWPSPVPVAVDNGIYWHEKPQIAADPLVPGRAYVVWARHLTPDPLDTPGTLDVDMAFARTEDGGQTWSWSEESPSIVPPDVEGRVEAALDIVTVPRPERGTSVVVGFGVWSDRQTAATIEMFTTHSEDGGRTWAAPGRVGAKTFVRTLDSEKIIADGNVAPREIEGGEPSVPNLAVAPDGSLYAVWQQRIPTAGSLIHVARSHDLGDTWSTVETMELPSPVLLPEVAVAGDGTVGVSFYDFRNDVPGRDASGGEPLTTDVWLRYSRDRGESWAELHLAGPFDMRTAPVDSGGSRYMLGDYGGMVGFPRGFGLLAALARPVAVNGQSDVFFLHIKLPPS